MKKYDYKERRYRDATKLEAAATYTRRILGVGMVVGLGYLALGKDDQPTALKADQAVAIAKYDKLYASQSPEGKFLTQYVHEIKVTADTEAEGGSGLIDLVSQRDVKKRTFTFNNACLRNSAYDTGGGYTEGSFNGFFSSGRVEGRSPTAVALAHVDRQEPDILEIRAGNDNQKVLRFSGVTGDSELEPADKRTEDVLATYGCQIGVLNTTVEFGAGDQIL